MSRIRFPVVLLSLLPAAAGLARAQGGEPASAFTEQAEVALVQVDVSVIDPKGTTRASVRGLTAADFDVRLEGKPLAAELRDRLIVDEICEPAEATLRPVLVFVDFNYINAQGRERVGKAIEGLAATPLPGVRYKFYGLTREIRALAPGFVADAEQIREVAALVRSSDYVSDRTVPPHYLVASRSLMTSAAGGCSG